MTLSLTIPVSQFSPGRAEPGPELARAQCCNEGTDPAVTMSRTLSHWLVTLYNYKVPRELYNDSCIDNQFILSSRDTSMLLSRSFLSHNIQWAAITGSSVG